jgi:hypothetical protein
VAIAGNIGELAKNTEELAKKADGAEKHTNEIANNMDEIKCSWSATSITRNVVTKTWPQGTR